MKMSDVTIKHSIDCSVEYDGRIVTIAEAEEVFSLLGGKPGAIKITLNADNTKSVVLPYDKKMWEEDASYRAFIEDRAHEQIALVCKFDEE